MKGKNLIIIILILIIILLSISFFVYIIKNKNTKNVVNTNIVNEVNNATNEVNNTKNEILNNTTNKTNTLNDNDNKSTDIISFKGYTVDEWKKMIDVFYKNYKNIDLKDIVLEYDDNNNFIATLTTQYEVCGEFIFDKDTGYAKEKNTKVVIDFINGKVITQIKNRDKMFVDNICLLIGYVTEQKEEEFINKYFESNHAFNSITRYDFRNEFARQSQYDEKFVVIPKDDNVKISVYEYFFGEDGNLYTRGALIEKVSEPFTIYYKNFEATTPQICIKLEYNGFNDEIPILFSGEDGKLALKGHETEVLDISIY